MNSPSAKNMYLSAYMKKSELIKGADRSLENSPMKITTLARVVDQPEKHTNHKCGAVIGSPNKHSDRWWEMNPRLNRHETERAVDVYLATMNPAQKRLSDAKNFTHNYNIKRDPNHGNAAGDYLDQPLKATKLLQSTAYNQLTIPGRAADFKSEVTFRMSLRN